MLAGLPEKNPRVVDRSGDVKPRKTCDTAAEISGVGPCGTFA
jgi:hypothetical protein